MDLADNPALRRWESGQPINRQLHDLVVPQLFVVSTGLAALERRLPADENAELIRDLVDVSSQALADLRSISRGEVVNDGGELMRVARRLRLAVETLGRLAERDISFTASGHAAIPAALEDDLAAVARESLANAIRHGNASAIEVDLKADRATLSLVVTDDGAWSDSPEAASSGLAGLQTRARVWGGRTMVDHRDDETRVVWQIPLDMSGRPHVRG